MWGYSAVTVKAVHSESACGTMRWNSPYPSQNVACSSFMAHRFLHVDTMCVWDEAVRSSPASWYACSRASSMVYRMQ